ncbi:adenosine kinase [Nematocida displodere]|uniref:Adenosine kinase n=1 Tax=Nematocida displodere TaxID=1805483 RepID=A0A177EEQ4_9MICR|nr:adenosine kinase [Nematocida displodere]
MARILTLCIPFVDIILNLSNLVYDMGIPVNGMTLYHMLNDTDRQMLHSHLDDDTLLKKGHGGVCYNTAIEVAKRGASIYHEEKVTSVFVGPFSNRKASNEVFGEALDGMVANLKVVSEQVKTDPAICYLLLNEENRAFITKPSADLVISEDLVDMLFDEIDNGAQEDGATLVYLAGYTAEAEDNLIKVIEKKNAGELNSLLVFNLSDPGVLQRSFQKILPFIEASDWVIGNRDEFIELFTQHHHGRHPNRNDQDRELLHFLRRTIGNFVMTNGGGLVQASFIEDGRQVCGEYMPPKQKVTNASGAGDVFAATVLIGIVTGGDMHAAIEAAIRRTGEFLALK